jgi:hypothetical protein
MSDHPPKIEGAPGLKWLRRKAGWEARWRARLDLVRKGFRPASLGLFRGAMPDEASISYIQAMCERMQNEMLVWGRGGMPEVARFDGTMKSLVDCYQADPDSRYGTKDQDRALRHQTRRNYDALCRRLVADHGAEKIADIKARILLRWHEQWAEAGKVAMAHALVGMLRTAIGFGATFLEDEDCARV